jgi:tight adherence protein C
MPSVGALYGAFVLLAGCVGASLGRLLSGVAIPPRPRLGHRGAQRRYALALAGGFAGIEPLLRFLAGIVADLPIAELRAQQDSELKRADDPLGLTPDELSACSLVACVVLGGAGWFVCRQLELTLLLALASAAFGLALPTIQLREATRARAKEISRGLPHAIEIVAMCMGAGHDFPGALRLVAAPHGKERSALSRELQVVLEHLDLGHTRREALLSFADRVRTPDVRDFVNAVVQAEQRGNPLAKVIQVQGHMLSLRRSVAAEEAAARAAVMMVAPMLALVCCVMLLLIGPFVVSGIGF